MWVGELEIRQENVEGFRQGLKIGIKLESQQASVRGEENFDWDSDVKVAKFSKFPRSCLKKKNDMKCFIKQSHILRVLPKAMEEYQTNHAMLLQLLSGKSCGYLEAVPDSDQVYRPLILMVTKDNQENEMLVGFCVDNPINQEHVRDKKDTITTFNKLFKENIKYSMVSTVVDQIWPGKDPGKEKALNNKNCQNNHAINENGDVPSNGMKNIVELARSVINTKTSEAAKDIQKDLLTAFIGSLSNLKADIPFENSDPETTKCDMILKYKSHTDWNINFYDKNINYLAIFVKNSSMDDEHVIFCKDSVNLLSYLTDIYDSEFKVSSITNQKGKISHPQIEKDIGIRVVENLSSFEQHFLKLGAFEEDLIIVEMEMLKKLCEQFEIKHEAEVMVIPKLESSPPFIFCSITSNETLARIETCDSKIEEGSPRVSFKRKHHNPDEIIEGRPKWSKIKMLRKSKVQTQNEKGTTVEEKVEEEILDFDRLNPHRSNVPEFDDNFENTEERYQKVVLKMMADLQSESVVTLGDCRLGPEQDKEYMDSFLKWEKYKKENKIYSSDFITKKKSKVDERLKVKVKNRIITKNPRKVTT
eukprot:TRINITY_DN19004_c0_g1_i2.p1 TRINITY_DN19004_c0_g1~~TRINITY_DN19004_c0_g1_i2.p1  ORF type:complete len:588 (-),score=148.81 TRINITY_DN19004_c0_g1_i2:43-1806(-)